MIEAVADAGPLIHLDEAGIAGALLVFRRITVPSPVAEEIRIQPRGPGTRLLRLRHVHVTAPSPDERAAAAALPLRRLTPADRLALAMSSARDVPLLTDDLDLRDAAKAIGVRPVGCIGLIVRAARIGMVSRAEALEGLDRLPDSSMFVTAALLERAKAAL